MARRHVCQEKMPTQNTPQYTKWKERSNSFARYYLTAFRAETDCYHGNHQNIYSYDWDAFESWIYNLQHDNSILSKLRLTALYVRVHSLKTSFRNKIIINKYRGRARDMWSKQQQDRYGSDAWYDRLAKVFDNELLDELEYQNEHLVLSKRITDQLQLQVEDDFMQCKALQRFNIVSCPNVTQASQADTNKWTSLMYTNNNVETIFRRAEMIYEALAFDECVTAPNMGPDVPDIVFITPEIIPLQLNERQKNVFAVYERYLIEPENENKLPPAIGLLTGSAGAGKTHVTNAIYDIGIKHNSPVLRTAFNNLNALDVDGPTLTQLAHLKAYHAKKQDNLTPGQFEKIVSTYDLQKARLIIIDEISNVAPHVLSRLDNVCKQVKGDYTKLFGGIPILMVGDMHQKPPVYGKSLTDALMQWVCYKRKNVTDPCDLNPTLQRTQQVEEFVTYLDPPLEATSPHAANSPIRIGAEIFSQCRWMELTEQQRSKYDTEHTSFVHHLYQGHKITLGLISKYKKLSQNDFQSLQSPWYTAPVIVRTNREKVTLNYTRAIQYAKLHNTIVIKWKTNVSFWEQKPQSEQDLDHVMQDPAFFEYFVQNAPGYCIDNICKAKKIVNGTKIQYKSLTIEEADQQWLQMKLNLSNPGDVIELPNPPISINVKLVDARPDDIIKWKHLTLHHNEVVIPILRKRINRWNETKKMPIPGVGRSTLPSRVRLTNFYPLEMSFAMTVEKAQGQTMNHVIIALSDRRANKCRFDYSSVYVAFSRVRDKNNLRILLSTSNEHIPNWSMLYLEHLKPSKSTFAFFAGYNSHCHHWQTDHWNEEKAYSYYNAH